MTASDGHPQIVGGEISQWPLLRIIYRTDQECINALLPPGIDPGQNPFVHLTIYNVVVSNEPEYGVVVKVEADYQGMHGTYALGYGIDQESAVFISQEINGQPKYPAEIVYFRLGDEVEARCTHQRFTFLEFHGRVVGPDAPVPVAPANEWWIKCSRAVGPTDKAYDFPPHVVRVATESGVAFQEKLEGELVLHDSPWDPLKEKLPQRELISAHLQTPIHKSREITLQGPLDPDAFWPFADTISGSRWPGERGGPKR